MDAPVGVPQEEGHTGFRHLPSAVLLALIFLARSTIQPLVPSGGIYTTACSSDMFKWWRQPVSVATPRR